MKIQMFAVYDQKAGAFLPPWNLPTKAMAARTFSDCANDPNHAFGKHPSDYTLFHVGEFDDGTAKIEGAKTSMGTAVEYLKIDDQPDMFPDPEKYATTRADDGTVVTKLIDPDAFDESD